MDTDPISQPMKAYVAYDGYSPEPYQTIVFARSRSEAKVQALKSDACEDAEYIGIRVHWGPKADKLYKGRSEIDWDSVGGLREQRLVCRCYSENGCGVCRIAGQNMNDTDFCSYGKRKEAT